MSNYTISKIIFNGSIQTITSTITGSGPDADFDMNETDAASVEIGDIVTGTGVASDIAVTNKQDLGVTGLRRITVGAAIPASNVDPLTLTFTRPINSIYKNQTGVMVITPKVGYVVGAVDFNHGSLPTGIFTVGFTDVGTAFAVGNTVNATVTIASDFTISADTVLTIPITGNARKLNASDVNNTASQFSIPINGVIDFTGATGVSISNVTSASSNVAVGTTGSGSDTQITITGNIDFDEDPDDELTETGIPETYIPVATFDVGFGDLTQVIDPNDPPAFVENDDDK